MMILVDCFVNREYIGGYIELYKAKTLTLNLLGVLIEMYIIIILIGIQIFVRQIGPHLKVNFNPNGYINHNCSHVDLSVHL